LPGASGGQLHREGESMNRVRSRWSVSLLAATVISTLISVKPASGATTLVEGEKGKIDVEFRLMAWAVDAGPDLIPGSNTAPPPAREENIQSFSTRRARLIFRVQLPPSLELVLQLGQDNMGSKYLRDDAGFRFKDAYINYKKNDALQIAVGQFKVPFLRQNLC